MRLQSGLVLDWDLSSWKGYGLDHSWILRRAGKKGEFRNGPSLGEGVVSVLDEWGVLDILRRDSEMGK